MKIPSAKTIIISVTVAVRRMAQNKMAHAYANRSSRYTMYTRKKVRNDSCSMW